MSTIILPSHYKQAQLTTKICFWHDVKNDHILQGGPEWMKPIKGYTQIVCTSAAEAEKWSERLRAQDKRITEASDEERDKIEGRISSALRAELVDRLHSAPNETTYLLVKKALAKHDAMEKTRRTTRLSYLHSEAFESGK